MNITPVQTKPKLTIQTLFEEINDSEPDNHNEHPHPNHNQNASTHADILSVSAPAQHASQTTLESREEMLVSALSTQLHETTPKNLAPLLLDIGADNVIMCSSMASKRNPPLTPSARSNGPYPCMFQAVNDDIFLKARVSEYCNKIATQDAYLHDLIRNNTNESNKEFELAIEAYRIHNNGMLPFDARTIIQSQTIYFSPPTTPRASISLTPSTLKTQQNSERLQQLKTSQTPNTHDKNSDSEVSIPQHTAFDDSDPDPISAPHPAPPINQPSQHSLILIAARSKNFDAIDMLLTFLHSAGITHLDSDIIYHLQHENLHGLVYRCVTSFTISRYLSSISVPDMTLLHSQETSDFKHKLKELIKMNTPESTEMISPLIDVFVAKYNHSPFFSSSMCCIPTHLIERKSHFTVSDKNFDFIYFAYCHRNYAAMRALAEKNYTLSIRVPQLFVSRAPLPCKTITPHQLKIILLLFHTTPLQQILRWFSMLGVKVLPTRPREPKLTHVYGALYRIMATTPLISQYQSSRALYSHIMRINPNINIPSNHTGSNSNIILNTISNSSAPTNNISNTSFTSLPTLPQVDPVRDLISFLCAALDYDKTKAVQLLVTYQFSPAITTLEKEVFSALLDLELHDVIFQSISALTISPLQPELGLRRCGSSLSTFPMSSSNLSNLGTVTSALSFSHNISNVGSVSEFHSTPQSHVREFLREESSPDGDILYSLQHHSYISKTNKLKRDLLDAIRKPVEGVHLSSLIEDYLLSQKHPPFFFQTCTIPYELGITRDFQRFYLTTNPDNINLLAYAISRENPKALHSLVEATCRITGSSPLLGALLTPQLFSEKYIDAAITVLTGVTPQQLIASIQTTLANHTTKNNNRAILCQTIHQLMDLFRSIVHKPPDGPDPYQSQRSVTPLNRRCSGAVEVSENLIAKQICTSLSQHFRNLNLTASQWDGILNTMGQTILSIISTTDSASYHSLLQYFSRVANAFNFVDLLDLSLLPHQKLVIVYDTPEEKDHTPCSNDFFTFKRNFEKMYPPPTSLDLVPDGDNNVQNSVNVAFGGDVIFIDELQEKKQASPQTEPEPSPKKELAPPPDQQKGGCCDIM